MADAQRLTVDRGLLHHAVTPLWSNKSKKELAQWFSDNGFARAYGSNPANWSGLINPFTGGRSYSQTHAVGQRVDDSTPDATAAERAAGYRVFYIIQDPKGQITWHAGNWEMNRRSIAIENLGDYRNYPLRDGDMKVIADFFRPLDQAVGGAMHILLHNQVYATACPARIAEAQQKIIDYINNPPAAPKPPTPPPAVTRTHREVFNPPKKMIITVDTELVNIPANTAVSPKVSFKKDQIIDQIADYQEFSDGTRFYRTKSSVDGNRQTGIGRSKIADYVEPPKWLPMDEPRSMRAPANISVIDLTTGQKAGSIAAGADTPFVEKKEQNGKVYLRSKWSRDNGKNWGVLFDNLQEIPKDVITTKDLTRTEAVPFTKTTEDDPTMLVGQTKLKTPGVDGVRTIVETVTYTNDKETKRVVKSSTVTTEPVAEVMLRGIMTKDQEQDHRLGIIERFIEALKKALEKIGIKL